MTHLSLVVMAAGTGVRYGGLKQIEPLGPNGEALMEYSIFDALRAGFDKVVFVIRRDIEDAFVDAVGHKVEKHATVEYVYQDDLEKFYEPVSGGLPVRGTGLAVLAAANAVDGSFGAINADDYYGPASFDLLAAHLREGDGDVAMVGFQLDATMSEFGSVRRGLCQVSVDGRLESVTELDKVRLTDGTITCEDQAGRLRHLRGDEIVSMNMWGFRPFVMDGFRRKLETFLADRTGAGQSHEFYVPSVVTELIHDGACVCRVLPTSSTWFGVTHREDGDVARRILRNLVANGTYAEDLWSAGV
jgi:hypothetical protein